MNIWDIAAYAGGILILVVGGYIWIHQADAETKKTDDYVENWKREAGLKGHAARLELISQAKVEKARLEVMSNYIDPDDAHKVQLIADRIAAQEREIKRLESLYQ